MTSKNKQDFTNTDRKPLTRTTLLVINRNDNDVTTTRHSQHSEIGDPKSTDS